MQQTGQTADWSGAEGRRVAAVVEKLASSLGAGETLAEVVHDARNMVTALWLYCDLLQEPGVLAASYLHYGNELRLVAASPLGLVGAGRGRVNPEIGDRSRPALRWDPMPAVLIDNLAAELLANRNLLAALAGPSIALTVVTEAGALPVWLTGEDLTRVLVNLVKNAAEAMPAGGKILLSLREPPAAAEAIRSLSMTVEDSGPGIPLQTLDQIFEAGFSTQSNLTEDASWPASHRGLGLSITRSILEKAGGRIVATNRAPDNQPPAGARFAIELPVRAR